MRGRWHSWVACWALAVLGAGVSLETTRHGHASWELDLRPHELARVAAAADCAGARHWDAATADHHPSCPACLGAATPSERPAAPATPTAQPGPQTSYVTVRPRVPRRAVTGVRQGRAPPRAALPTP
jgi:hypothetical protein